MPENITRCQFCGVTIDSVDEAPSSLHQRICPACLESSLANREKVITENMTRDINHRPIILIEDNPDEMGLVLRYLRQQKIPNPVFAYATGSSGLKAIFTQSGMGMTPAFIILDLLLPDMDGQAVIRQLKADVQTAEIPLVVLTCLDSDEAVIESYDRGANSYSTKPSSAERFKDLIQSMCRYWLKVVTLPRTDLSTG